MISLSLWVPVVGVTLVLLLLCLAASLFMNWLEKWLEKRKRELTILVKHRRRVLALIDDMHRRNLEELARGRAEQKQKGLGATPARNSLNH